MRIVDPTDGTPADEEAATAAGDAAPAGTLCLFSNSKPGATDLLQGVADRLGTERGETRTRARGSRSGCGAGSAPTSVRAPGDDPLLDGCTPVEEATTALLREPGGAPGAPGRRRGRGAA